MDLAMLHLDEETRKLLESLVARSGLPAEAVIEKALRTIESGWPEPATVAPSPDEPRPTPWEVYSAMDLGEGDESIAPSTETGRHYREALRRKRGI